MLRNIFLKELRDRRVSLFWWAVSIFLLVLMIGSVWPSVQKSATGLESYLENLPEAFKAAFMVESGVDITSAKGFLNAELFSLMIPIMFVVFAIGFGSSAIAGEEETGTLDLLLANPLPRGRVLLEKFAALVIGMALLGFVLWLSLVIIVAIFDMDVAAGSLAAATTSSSLLGLTFGMFALALGSATGRKGLAIGVAIALTAGSYLLNILAKSAEFLKDYDKLSLFYYLITADPMSNGLYWGDILVFLGVTAVLLAIALLGFQRRDLAV